MFGLEFNTVILVITIVVGLYMAWNIGANDVANAMGTSVGSKALTLKNAVIVAAILEFSGAFLVGSHVTDTVRKGLIDPSIFMSTPNIVIFGMLSALLAAAVWLQIATYFGLPVSTTHSIVGAILGFALVAGGVDAINWIKVLKIVASWVVSPLLGGVFAFLIFNIIRVRILNAINPIEATKKIAPYLVGSVLFILTLVLLFKGLKQLHLDLSFINAMQIAGLVAVISGILSRYGIRYYIKKQNVIDEEAYEVTRETKELKVQLKQVRRLLKKSEVLADDSIQWKINRVKDELKECMTDVTRRGKGVVEEDKKVYQIVERVFIFLQILSACFVAFAHGANDVANAIGPMAAIIGVLKTGTVEMQVAVPLWVLAAGGIGIVVGLATWGWRVIETIGKKITELTPTRGFAAEFGAATTIVIASKLGLPISTTHTLVGSVLGVGLARGVASLNINVIRNILLSWFVTLPAGAGLAIIFFNAFKALLG
ncbi:inorganic phosphate transporter [Candidatus Marinamargulisbacteria bacterium SCGC AG-343-D04]|nr:inorganic phosphate transporter [Candidatus Marinamargulisbacteria bacterium SCGC AG-343-D04]